MFIYQSTNNFDNLIDIHMPCYLNKELHLTHRITRIIHRKDVFFLGLAASALHRMNLLRWQTWNGSSWGVASMENSTWMLWQGGNEALFPSSAFSRFCNVWQYIKALGSTTPLQSKRHYALTPHRYESLSSENWKMDNRKSNVWNDIMQDRGNLDRPTLPWLSL